MSGKRTLLLSITVVVAVIVAGPYLVGYLLHPPSAQIIKVENGVTNVTWSISSSTNDVYPAYFSPVNAVATAISNNSLISSVTLSVGGVGFYNVADGFYQLCISDFTVTGNLSSELSVAGLTLSQQGSSEFQNVVYVDNTYLPGLENTNVSELYPATYAYWNDVPTTNNNTTYTGSFSAQVSFLNYTSNSTFDYHFKSSNALEFSLFLSHLGHTVSLINLTFAVELKILGEMVLSEVNLAVENP